jgi:hypothetical protein
VYVLTVIISRAVSQSIKRRPAKKKEDEDKLIEDDSSQNGEHFNEHVPNICK